MQVRKNKMLAYTPHPLLKHMRTHTHMHKCMHACTHAQMYACTHASMYTHTYSYMHACTHLHTHTYTHTNKCTHMYAKGIMCVLTDANYTCFTEQKLFLVVIHCIVTMCLLLRLRVPFWKVTFHDLLFLF